MPNKGNNRKKQNAVNLLKKIFFPVKKYKKCVLKNLIIMRII